MPRELQAVQPDLVIAYATCDHDVAVHSGYMFVLIRGNGAVDCWCLHAFDVWTRITYAYLCSTFVNMCMHLYCE